MSEILVGSIEPLAESLGWTELFIGMIFVAIIGNAAEHVSAITIAMKGRMDLVAPDRNRLDNSNSHVCRAGPGVYKLFLRDTDESDFH